MPYIDLYRAWHIQIPQMRTLSAADARFVFDTEYSADAAEVPPSWHARSRGALVSQTPPLQFCPAAAHRDVLAVGTYQLVADEKEAEVGLPCRAGNRSRVGAHWPRRTPTRPSGGWAVS